MFDAPCKGLARKGHRIDAISHFSTKTPIDNCTDIVDLSGTRPSIVNGFTVEDGRAMQEAMTYYIATKFGGDLCDLMGHERMRRFIENPVAESPYDLVINHFRYLGAVCYLGFGHLLNAPIAIAASFMRAQIVDDLMGNPHSYAFFPGPHYENAMVATLIDRLSNVLSNLWHLWTFYRYTSDQTEVMRKYLGRDVSDVRQLERDVALASVNDHHSIGGVRLVTAAVINVGGIRVEFDDTELPLELKRWLDSANHGVVYFTFGSVTNVETLPRDTLLALYASFEKIAPAKVLMRCADDTKLPPDLPDNVSTKPWLPQIPVLKHQNTRAFITHGGLMGSEEAVYYGVPMIGIPLFADQMKNVNIFDGKNVAISMRLENITERTMDYALDAILHDPKYKESADRLSRLFRDRPMSAIDPATYWIEYVIRNGPDSLRSAAAGMPWWKLNLIDVFAVIISCLLAVVAATAIAINALPSKICRHDGRAKKMIN
ncbi:UDP-glucosyltransferase 2 [Augochlora pura]